MAMCKLEGCTEEALQGRLYCSDAHTEQARHARNSVLPGRSAGTPCERQDANRNPPDDQDSTQPLTDSIRETRGLKPASGAGGRAPPRRVLARGVGRCASYTGSSPENQRAVKRCSALAGAGPAWGNCRFAQ